MKEKSYRVAEEVVKDQGMSGGWRKVVDTPKHMMFYAKWKRKEAD